MFFKSCYFASLIYYDAKTEHYCLRREGLY